MNQSLVITAIGEDRPGIVNELTEILLNTHLHIKDSRMSLLGGEFAIILLVTGNEASIEDILQQQISLEKTLKLKLLIKATTSSKIKDDVNTYLIKVEGMDNPGTVHKLARFLSQHAINISNMQTDSSHAPHTGTPLFTVNMRVEIPANQDINQLRNEFIKICDELSMDVEFNPAWNKGQDTSDQIYNASTRPKG